MIARLYAFMYDRIGRGSEAAGLQRERVALLAHARGNTVEIGAGTGLNLDHYPVTIDDLVLTDPDPHMLTQLRHRLAASGGHAQVVQAPAEHLPFPDESFDTVVSTWALCTVDDPEKSLADIRRVLKPGGRLLFLEHVRSEDSERAARWQDRATPFVRRAICGCRPNRRTLATIEASGLQIETVRAGTQPKGSLPWEKPMIVGVASKTR